MFRRLTLAIFFFAALAGCAEQSLVENITARQSVEVLVTLRKHGISASRQEREGGRELRYDVFVVAQQYPRALEIIHEYNLPQENQSSVTDLTKQRGFVPNSPEITALRLDHALALEAERLILSLPGIVDAKVLVRSQLATASSWRGEDTQPGSRANASVVVRFSKEAAAGMNPPVEEIKGIIARTVPSIDPTAIEVIVSELGVFASKEAQEALAWHRVHGLNFHVPATERLNVYQSIFALVVSSIVVGALFALAIFYWNDWRRRQENQRIRRQTMTFQQKSLLPDGSADEPLDRRLR